MFLDTLPDPNFKINSAGVEDVSGTAGPGFATVGVNIKMPIMDDDTIIGKSVLIAKQKPKWELTVNYNPLTQAQFAPIYYFLMEKRGSKKSFYISMPQYAKPKDTDFATYVASNAITTSGNATAGEMNLLITASTWSANTYADGVPTIGDVFTITDSNDSLHEQIYMVSHVDTYDTYDTLPGSGTVRVHFFPGLQRDTTTGATVNFDGPLFRVTQQQNLQEYSLDKDGLYSFSLKLEEALY